MNHILSWGSVSQWNCYGKCNFLLSELTKWMCSLTVLWMLFEGHLCKAVPLWEKQPSAILSCMCLNLFIYFQFFMQATRWHKCSHGSMVLVYVILPEFCPEFPLLLCIISGILADLRGCSCLQMDKPMASSSSVYISYHCCILPYFISLSDIERGVQCKIMVTKPKEAMKTLSGSMQWYCFVHRQPLQQKGSEVCSHWKETDPFCMARAPRPLLMRLLVLMPWALEENCWDLLVLPPSWASTASSSLGGLSSNGGLVLLLWCDPGVNWAH